ncbi:MAG: hypothetical protein ACLFQT_01830 [Thiohalophilus sp.]
MPAHPLDRLPSLRVIPKQIPAPVYNTLRLVVLRHPHGVRLGLSGLRPELWALLDRRGWALVDGLYNDLPVMAWTAFGKRAQAALHKPVGCELRLYHRAAGLIMGPGLDALYRAGSRCLGRECREHVSD